MKVKDLISFLESIAPLHYQMSYDNSGLLVGGRDAIITNVLVSLDCIESIVDEAIDKNCNVIVSHHPIIFSGLKRLTGDNYVQRTVMKAIKNDISLYAIHTNLDSILYQGVNTEIAHRIGLEDISILAPALEHNPDKSVGAGLYGTLAQPMVTEAFLHHLKQSMRINVIKHTMLTRKSIYKVALCGGSGGFLLNDAKRVGADIFITADYKYHEYFDADGDLVIADIGHYESEQFTIDLLHRIINKKFSTFAALKTEISTNPVKYF